MTAVFTEMWRRQFFYARIKINAEEVIAKDLNPKPIIAPKPQVKFFFVDDPNGVTV